MVELDRLGARESQLDDTILWTEHEYPVNQTLRAIYDCGTDTEGALEVLLTLPTLAIVTSTEDSLLPKLGGTLPDVWDRYRHAGVDPSAVVIPTEVRDDLPMVQ